MGKAGGWGMELGAQALGMEQKGNFHCLLYLTDCPCLASLLSSGEYNPVLKDEVQRE